MNYPRGFVYESVLGIKPHYLITLRCILNYTSTRIPFLGQNIHYRRNEAAITIFFSPPTPHPLLGSNGFQSHWVSIPTLQAETRLNSTAFY